MADEDLRNRRPQEEESTNDAKRPRTQQVTKGSKVLHVRALPGYVTEQELVDVVKKFGECTKVLLLQDKNQAFVEMKEPTLAAAVLSGLEISMPTIRNKRCYWQYSDRPEIEAKTAVYVVNNRVTGETQGSSEGVTATTPTILLLISAVTIPVTIEAVHQVGSAFGTIYRIITFNKGADYQALLEFASIEEAEHARANLDGKDLYEGCCHIRASFSTKQFLTVKQNDHRSWDYTVPQAGVTLFPPMYYPYPGYGVLPAGPSGVSHVTISSATALTAPAASAPLVSSSVSSASASASSQEAPISTLPPNASLVKCDLINCFASKAFQGTSVRTLAVERKMFSDHVIFQNLTREFNSLVVFFSSSAQSSSSSAATATTATSLVTVASTSSTTSASSSYDLCWAAPGWKEGEDPYVLNAVFAAAHFVLSSPTSSRSIRSLTFTPRTPLSTTLSVRQEIDKQSRLYWTTLNLSPDDAFTEEPWVSAKIGISENMRGFLQGLNLDPQRVKNVERNARGVIIIAVKEEADVIKFGARMLSGSSEHINLLVITAQTHKQQRAGQNSYIDLPTRVFVADEYLCLKEDYGGASAAVASMCFWYSKISKVMACLRNPSTRSSQLFAKLLAGPAVSGLPFSRVEIGGSCHTTLAGHFSL